MCFPQLEVGGISFVKTKQVIGVLFSTLKLIGGNIGRAIRDHKQQLELSTKVEKVGITPHQKEKHRNRECSRFSTNHAAIAKYYDFPKVSLTMSLSDHIASSASSTIQIMVVIQQSFAKSMKLTSGLV
jgi:hypothetical protein